MSMYKLGCILFDSAAEVVKDNWAEETRDSSKKPSDRD